MIERMWIDQPSTLQPLHHLHGRRVLVLPSITNMRDVFFTEGDVVSMRITALCLSPGWPGHLLTPVAS